MRLVILGGPGAGKGTQAQKLCQPLGISPVSTGDILREAIATQSALGRQAQFYVEKGELVPDNIMIEFMRERLLQPDTANGWVLEGYPRTAFQAEELDFLLDELEQQLNWAIYLQVPQAVMISRSIGRTYTPEGVVPLTDLRLDDQPEILQRRIDVFGDRIPTLLDYYGHRQRLLSVNADQPPEQVQQEILQKLQV